MKLHLPYHRIGVTLLLVVFSLSTFVLGVLPAAASHECAAAELDRNFAWELGVTFLPSSGPHFVANHECAVVGLDRNTVWELGVSFSRDDANSIRSHAVVLAVSDQQPVNGTVVVERIFSHGPGYVVVYGDYKGEPALVIGHAPVTVGWNYNVQVPINMARKVSTAYAILHSDSNQVGVYELGMAWGADAPVLVNGLPVMIPFKLYYPAIR